MMGKRGKSLLSFLSTWHPLILDAVILTGIGAFLLVYYQPHLLFAPTITTGGDTGSHYYTAKYLKEVLLPQGRISGWTQAHYAGFPLLQFYFPLPFLLMAFLSFVSGGLIPLQVAFKLVSALGSFLLPSCAYASLRLMGYAFPVPIVGALSTLPFLFMEANSMWGGNIPSSMSGEFSYSIAFSLAILFHGLLYRGITSPPPRGRGRILCGVLVAVIGMCHGYPLLFAGTASSFFLFTTRDFFFRLRHLLSVYLLGFALMGMWILPLLLFARWATTYGETWNYVFSEAFPRILYPGAACAVLGSLVSWIQQARSRSLDPRLLSLWFAVAVAIVMHLTAPATGVVDIRYVPFAQVYLMVLGAVGVGALIRPFAGQWAVPVIISLALVSWIPRQVTYIATWMNWNYSGFENKQFWPAYSRLARELEGGPGDPRVVDEHSGLHNAAGTPRAFESFPLFSGRSVMEGLYHQASHTAPFFFYTQAEYSPSPSCPFSRYACTSLNLDKAVTHLQMFNVKHLIAITDPLKEALKKNPSYHLTLSAPPYEVYEIPPPDGGFRYVAPLRYEPVLMEARDLKDWKTSAYEWFRNFEINDITLVSPLGTTAEDRGRFPVVRSLAEVTRIPSPQNPPIPPTIPSHPPQIPPPPLSQRGVGGIISASGAGGEEVHEEIRNDEIIFTTPLIGRPHLIRISYHPNWKVEGAEKIYLVSPSFMMVIPTETRVRLSYGRTWPDYLGLGLTVGGLLVLIRPLRVRTQEWAHRIVRPVSARLRRMGVPPLRLRRIRVFSLGRRARLALLAVCAVGVLIAAPVLVARARLNEPTVLLNKGVKAKDAKDFARARATFQRLLDTAPSSGAADQAGYYLGILFYLEKNWDKAIEEFQRYLVERADSIMAPEAAYHIGLSYKELQEIERAKAAFRTVTERYAGTAWAHLAEERLQELAGLKEDSLLYGRAIALFNTDRCEEATPLYEQIISRFPSSPLLPETLSQYALCYYKEKNYAKTIEVFKRLVEGFPAHPLTAEGLYHIGLSYSFLGDAASARRYYALLKDRFPQTPWAGYVRERLSEMK